MRISAGTPVRAFKLSNRLRVSRFGSVVFPTNSTKKAVSMLKLARAGLSLCDAVDGSVEGPFSLRTGRFAALTRSKKKADSGISRANMASDDVVCGSHFISIYTQQPTGPSLTTSDALCRFVEALLGNLEEVE